MAYLFSVILICSLIGGLQLTPKPH